MIWLGEHGIVPRRLICELSESDWRWHWRDWWERITVGRGPWNVWATPRVTIRYWHEGHA